MQPIVIIGGGVAGLSAANRLQDLGIHPLVIEAGRYPTDKICGEFLSPECLPTLSSWDIVPPRHLTRIMMHYQHRRASLALTPPAGSMPRVALEAALLARADKATILTETKVTDIRPGFLLTLSNGEQIRAKQLIISTGKFSKRLSPLYYGMKTHLPGLTMEDTLEMHLFPGIYAGLSPVGDDQVNLALLSTRPLDLPGERWLKGRVPAFGWRKVPSWPGAYFIGDAALSIPPITGEGLAISITSGCMAAEAAAQEGADGFRKQMKERYQKRLFWGHWMHRLALRPKISFPLHKLSPNLINSFYSLSREFPLN